MPNIITILVTIIDVQVKNANVVQHTDCIHTVVLIVKAQLC